jgi:hypothetical protein
MSRAHRRSAFENSRPAESRNARRAGGGRFTDQIWPRRKRCCRELESGTAPAHRHAAQSRLVRHDRRGKSRRADGARSDASPDAVDNRVDLPPAKRIDELGDFLEWLANAKPEDEQIIRAEINRYWGSVGDMQAVGTLNYMLSQVLKPGTTQLERQQILDLIDNYSRHDPAEVGQFYDQLFDLFALLGTGLLTRPWPKPPAVPLEIEFETARLALSGEQRAAIWKLGWAKRGKVLDGIFRKGNLHDLSRTIDDLVDNVAISNKSVDLNAATYQDFRRLLSRMSQDLEKLEAYFGTDWGGDSIKATDMASKELRLIIPMGSMTPVQREAIKAATRIARSKNIRLIVTEF